MFSKTNQKYFVYVLPMAVAMLKAYVIAVFGSRHDDSPAAPNSAERN
jgi:hypothetical protein